MYLLMSGTCVASVDGKTVGSLDGFGGGALFGERKRSATVMAKEELQLLVLERTDMEKSNIQIELSQSRVKVI